MAAAATDLSAAPHAGVAGAPQGAGAGMAFVRILFYTVPMDDEELSLPEGLRVAGRGARRNMSGRFEAETRAPVHDGWSIAEEARPLRTELRAERPRRIIARNDSPDIPFDRGLNPYRGCEHGCAYCYARATHAHLGLSPGLDFESRLVMRPQAPAVLARELRARGYDPRPMAIGTATDPYQPAEQAQRITRGVLEVLREFSHPATITTRGALIARDLDILAPPGAARARTGAAARGDRGAGGGGRAGAGDDRPGDPGAHRSRARGDPCGGGAGRGALRSMAAPSAAERGRAIVSRLAGAARTGARGAGARPAARDAWRARL